jgi:glycosyltransferase involved in cell wall biosynthesis
MQQSRVLVMVDWYAPGFKAGGPIRSAVNFADQLEEDLDIWVFTTDRDLGDTAPYPGVIVDQWVQRGNHQVFYASPAFLTWSNIFRLIRDIAPGFLYLNSMFSRYCTIYPLLMHRFGFLDVRVVLAPRGMLRRSALAHKPGKKKLFLRAFRLIGLGSNVEFQPTDDAEADDVRQVMGVGTKVLIAGNLPGRQRQYAPPPVKSPGMLRIVFVGRIHPIKNLLLLLEALQHQQADIELIVIATPEDEAYLSKCEQMVQAFPENIRVRFMMNLPHEKIEPVILASHIFALPTRGENFGHAIFEALSAGRPVLISDQTPWRRLTGKMAGWDLPLENGVESFAAVIRSVADWDHNTLDSWCRGAWQAAADYLGNNTLKQSYLKQFT